MAAPRAAPQTTRTPARTVLRRTPNSTPAPQTALRLSNQQLGALIQRLPSAALTATPAPAGTTPQTAPPLTSGSAASDTRAQQGVRKPPPLSPAILAQMDADVERTVRLLKRFATESADQISIIGPLLTYERLDRYAPEFGGGKASPHVDKYLLLLKVRVFARSNWKSLGQDQWTSAYDALWHSLTGYYLSDFKRVVDSSHAQKTDGPTSDAPENGALLIARQEAIGMWGLLKGMGTSLAAVAGPVATQALAEDFDETGRILFGADWDADTKLVAGMNAAQIGTIGGEVIAMLISFARSAGAQGGRVYALLNRLRHVTDKAQRLIDVLNGLQGVTLSAIAIARRIEELQKASPDGKVTWQQVSEDTIMLDQVVALTSSVATTMLAGRPPRDGAALMTRARIHLLLKSAQVVALGTNLVTIAAKDVSQAQKDLESTQVWLSLIPLLFSVALDVPGAKHVKRDAAALDARNAAEQSKAAADAEQVAAKQDSKAPPPATQDATSASSTGNATPSSVGDASTERDADMERIADRHQQLMEVQAAKALGPRKAPVTPDDVRTGKRAPRYVPGNDGRSVTVVEGARTLTQARKVYDDVIAETSGKYEVGIWQNVVDGTYTVRLGQPAKVGQPAPKGWRPVQHFHTNAPDVALWRGPAPADVRDAATRAAAEGRALTEIVEHPLGDGMRGRAAYTARPDGSLTVEFQRPDGTRSTKNFASVKDFEVDYLDQKVYFDPSRHPEINAALLADAKQSANPASQDDDVGARTMVSPGKKPTKNATVPTATGGPAQVSDSPETGVRIPLTRKEVTKRIPHLQEMEKTGKWADLPASDDALRLGKTFDKIVRGLVMHLAAGRGPVLYNKPLTKSMMKSLRAKGGRVLFAEVSLGAVGKADYVEIDFGTGRVTLIDLTAQGRTVHTAKTLAYKKRLEAITGMPVDASELRYVGPNGDFLDTLLEVPIN